MIPALLMVVVALPVGLELEGELHVDAELGPLSTRGSFEAEAEVAAGAPAGVPAARWETLCRTARQIRRLGTLRGPFTGAWLLDIAEDDLVAIFEGLKEVDTRAATFRATRGAAPPGDVPGGPRDGVGPG